MTQKLLNGQLVDLTPEEQAEYDARNAPAAIAAEADAQLERVVDDVLELRGGVKAVALAVFEIYDRLAAAGVTGFPVLTNAQKRQFIKDRIN